MWYFIRDTHLHCEQSGKPIRLLVVNTQQHQQNLNYVLMLRTFFFVVYILTDETEQKKYSIMHLFYSQF
jgi:hypothetical protein